MVAFNYSNISAETTLTSGISATSTVVALNSSSGLPVSYPYSLIVDYGQANVEVVTVTGPSGLNFTVTRGDDGTAAQAHNPGARVVHGVVARDLKQPQDHIAAATGVHGVAGSVVGTTDAQTLSSKTINGASNTLTVRDADVTGLSASKLSGNFNGGSSFVSVADATVPLTAKGTATATANLLELYKGAANQFAVDAAGRVTHAGASAGGSFDVTRALATDTAVSGKVTGDTTPRVAVQADGSVKWGPGNAASDVTMSRTAVNTVGLNGNLDMGAKKVTNLAAPTAVSDAITKAYSDGKFLSCTSTTRPVTPVANQLILETDTSIVRMWNGVGWQQLTAYRQVYAVTAAGGDPTIVFSGIPTTLKTLRLSYAAMCTGAVNATSIALRFNGNATTNYFYHMHFIQNTTVTANSFINIASLQVGQIPGNNGTVFGVGTVDIAGWDLTGPTTDRLTVRGQSECYPSAADSYLLNAGGIAVVAPPWTSVTLLPGSGNFGKGTRVSLEGWE